MSLFYVQGDLFSSKDCLAHCVSRDLRMGKGIAVEFKRRFGGTNKVPVSNLLVIEDSSRYIYYLITKERYHNKPTYDSLRNSLVEMREHMIQHNVTKLSIPRIGCGLDRLNWDNVSVIISEVFAHTGIDITVYSI